MPDRPVAAPAAATDLGAAIIVTPNPADAQIACGLLAERGLGSRWFANVGEVAGLANEEVGCLVIVEEALVQPALADLQQAIQMQPPWSDVPVILVASESTPLGSLADQVFPVAGNITVLQRPLHPVSLVSAVNVALRARQRQYQVRELLAVREAALRRRDEFLAMLAHELRNPLAPIRNAVHILGTMKLGDEKFDRCRAMIEKQASHITRLVDDLLDVSRLELGKVELRLQPVNLDECVAAAVEACTPITGAHRHAVRVLAAPEPLWVSADPVRLEQCFGNLLVNAAKFTAEGGSITVQVAREGESGVVSVTDTGIGIRPEMIDSIFELFTQDEVGIARSRGGLGIGLTLVKRLVDLHGGSVRALSRGSGQGTTIEVRLPLAAALVEGPGAPDTERRSGSAKRVLIVEDGEDNRESLAMLLAGWGHEVLRASDGADGLRKALESQPDVAVVDIGLPVFDGYELARRIRQSGAQHAQRIRLIALTGYGQVSDRQKALEAGFDVHLLKPVDPAQLRALLSSRTPERADERVW